MPAPSSQTPLQDAFHRGTARQTAPADLEPALGAFVDAGRAAWPDLGLDPAAFCEHLGRLLAKEATPAVALQALRAADLYLAFGCLARSEAAVTEVKGRLTARQLASRGVRLGALEVYVEEGHSQILDQVLVGSASGTPEIARYSGRGKLDAWLATVAVHAALKLKRRATRNAAPSPTGENEAAALGAGADLELAFIKDRYRQDFNEAFHEALASLPSRDKTVLRLSVVEKLGIDAIGTMFRVHRATAARWLVKVRSDLADRTREALARRIGASPDEVDSLVGMLQSQVEVSLDRALETRDE